MTVWNTTYYKETTNYDEHICCNTVYTIFLQECRRDTIFVKKDHAPGYRYLIADDVALKSDWADLELQCPHKAG